jgi:hypothetical protein
VAGEVVASVDMLFPCSGWSVSERRILQLY